MGLDQYLFKTKASIEEIESSRKIDSDKEIQQEEIAYWRKHPNLQGYIRNIWLQKNKNIKPEDLEWAEDFNGDNVYLTEQDLNEWESAAKAKRYPSTTGFFFGSNRDEEYLEHDLASIQEARKALKEGFTVYYTSWW